MEANENQVSEAPDFEKQIQETKAERESQDYAFEKGMGLPIEPRDNQPPPADAPEAVQDIENLPAQPTAPPQDFTQNEVADPNNDQVRYQYWQSKAAKLQNQVKEMEQYAPMVDYLRNNPEAVKQVDTAQHAEAAVEQESEEFPPPPERPAPPPGFSRDDAISDPASESAQYVAQHEQWRDDMVTYNALQNQYQVAQVREEYKEKFDKLEAAEAKRQEAINNQKEMRQIRHYVTERYGLNGQELNDFINTMNNPKSINMDDLVGYYQFKKGTQGQFRGTPPAQPTQPVPPTPNQPPVPSGPSQAFSQTKRAQSVPTPMGVQTAADPNQTPKVSFMDELISDNNNNNIL